MSARQTVLILFAAVPAALMSVSASAGPWLPQPGEYYCEFTGGYGSFDRFFNAEGERQRYDYGSSYQQREFSSTTELGWKKWASLSFTVPVRSTTFRTETYRWSSTQTGVGDLRAGVRAKLLDGATALAAEADWIGPAGYEREAFPSLGAGRQHVAGVVRFGTPIRSSGFVQASWGYYHQFETSVDGMIHTAEVAVWLGSSILVSGHYEGAVSVGVSKPEESDFYTHSAGPELRYRLDDRMDVFAGSWHTVAGSNVELENRYYVGFAVKQTRLNRLQGFLGGKRRS